MKQIGNCNSCSDYNAPLHFVHCLIPAAYAAAVRLCGIKARASNFPRASLYHRDLQGFLDMGAGSFAMIPTFSPPTPLSGGAGFQCPRLPGSTIWHMTCRVPGQGVKASDISGSPPRDPRCRPLVVVLVYSTVFRFPPLISGPSAHSQGLQRAPPWSAQGAH